MTFKEFRKQYEKVLVEQYSHNVIEKPLVSICVMTYQHAPFITDCLEGILMQKTDFIFEILLGEDDSTDDTRNICIEYAKRYPEKIRLFLHRRENNIHYFGHPSGKFNLLYNLSEAQGTYLAFCEGDDYWTDPLKLQKQINVLKNSNSKMCVHETTHLYYPEDLYKTWKRAILVTVKDIQLYGFKEICPIIYEIIFDRKNFWNRQRYYTHNIRKKIIFFKDIYKKRWFMPFCSIVMKKELIEPVLDCYVKTESGHELTLLLGAIDGGILMFKQKMGVKRDQITSMTYNKDRVERKKNACVDINTSPHLMRYRCLRKKVNGKNFELLNKKIQLLKGDIVKYHLRQSKIY